MINDQVSHPHSNRIRIIRKNFELFSELFDEFTTTAGQVFRNTGKNQTPIYESLLKIESSFFFFLTILFLPF